MTSLPDVPANVPAEPTAVKLSVADRYLLSLLLPGQGTRQQMLIADSIDRLIGFDAAEIKQYGIRYDSDGALRFTSDALTEFAFADGQLSLIRLAVDEADRQGAITRAMLPLLDRLEPGEPG